MSRAGGISKRDAALIPGGRTPQFILSFMRSKANRDYFKPALQTRKTCVQHAIHSKWEMRYYRTAKVTASEENNQKNDFQEFKLLNSHIDQFHKYIYIYI